MRRVAVIVPAAGRGERLGAGLPKAFVELAGRPLLAWTLERLQSAAGAGVERIVVALPDDEAARAAFAGRVAPDLAPAPVVETVPGGETRQESVWSGLQRLGPDWDVIAVHDGARPFVTAELVERVVDAAARCGAAVPGLVPSDTVKVVEPATGATRVESTLPRAHLRAVQTPQAFAGPLLHEAYRAAVAEGFTGTDDASLVERLGHPVSVVPGDPENLKVTTPLDLIAAEARLASGGLPDPADAFRVGFGIDVHRFAPADAPRPLVLGGVRLSDRGGLLGHSDADAVVHAVMDALLGAAGLEDIGALFPPDDPAFAGADSMELLARVRARLAERGWRPAQLDVTVVAERPRLAPHAASMRERLAAALGLPVWRVGLKATTPEGLGSLGRGEGLAAYAVCVLRRAL